MEKRDEAFGDYQNGMKYKEIAEKYGVSLSTVKSWAARYWRTKKTDENGEGCKKVAAKTKKSETTKKGCKTPKSRINTEALSATNKKGCKKVAKKVATEKEKKLQPSDLETVKSEGGQPCNENALKHGGYSAIYWDTLTEEERELIDSLPVDEITQLVEQIKLYAVRERRLLKAIDKIKGKANKQGDIETNSNTLIVFDDNKPKINSSNKTLENGELATLRLEKELTAVQRSKTKSITALAEIRTARGDSKDAWVDEFLSVIEEGL